jgi:hypothetical protein
VTRINIVLDDEIIKQAMQVSGAKAPVINKDSNDRA